MTFTALYGRVLSNIGKYGETATNIVAQAGQNVNDAIARIVANVLTERLTKEEEITTVDRSTSLNPTYTPSSTDIDQIMKVRYSYSDDEWDLDKVTFQTLRQRISDLTDTGRPEVYLIKGQTSNIINLDFYPITAYAGETIIVEYLPILAELSSTQENIVTIRYAQAVIEIATKLSRRNILNEPSSEDEIDAFVNKICTKINAREQSDPDYKYNRLPPDVLIARRKSRRTI